jgi:hypothetical protein
VGAPVPFRTKKGEEFSPWKAVVNGKTLELAPASSTQEEAATKLAEMNPQPTPSVKQSQKSLNLGDLFKKTDTTPEAASSPSTDLKDTTGQTEKPKPGEIRKNGLADLSPARLKAFRDQVAYAIATGNVSLDRALISIFRDNVPFLLPEQYLLLSTGWELACEQYFVNGVPPAWIIILLGNAMVCTSLYEKSEPKKEEALPTNDGTITAPANGAPKNK